MIEPHIQMIGSPDIKIEDFLRVVNKTGITRPIDNTTRKLSDIDRFLISLSCFHDDNQMSRPAHTILRDSTHYCQHLFYTYMFSADKDTIVKSMERSQLTHTLAEGLHGRQLAVVSGTLAQWKQSCLDCTLGDPFLVALYNKVVIEFERQGIVFHDLKKTANKDSTFRLEHKSPL